MELGSEFNLRLENLREEEKNNIYKYLKDYNTIYLDSGRSGLRLLCDALCDGEVLLPEYICKSVMNCFKGKNIKFYKLKSNLQIDEKDLFRKINVKTSIVYLMHYFGALQSEETCLNLVEEKIKHNFTIIEDTTHSIFSQALIVGDYGVCSLRKWFAIPDGGVLYSKKSLDKFLNKTLINNTKIKKAYGMILKTLYLDGVLDCNNEYREIFNSSENSLDENDEVYLISVFSKCLLKCISINDMVDKRRENYTQLFKGLSNIGLTSICPISSSDCPLTFPLRINNRDHFKNYLMNNKIYCAIHWPESKPKLADEIISLPIDQRYGFEEIEYLINTIIKYERDPLNENSLTLI